MCVVCFHEERKRVGWQQGSSVAQAVCLVAATRQAAAAVHPLLLFLAAVVAAPAVRVAGVTVAAPPPAPAAAATVAAFYALPLRSPRRLPPAGHAAPHMPRQVLGPRAHMQGRRGAVLCMHRRTCALAVWPGHQLRRSHRSLPRNATPRAGHGRAGRLTAASSTGCLKVRPVTVARLCPAAITPPPWPTLPGSLPALPCQPDPLPASPAHPSYLSASRRSASRRSASRCCASRSRSFCRSAASSRAACACAARAACSRSSACFSRSALVRNLGCGEGRGGGRRGAVAGAQGPGWLEHGGTRAGAG